MFEKVKGTELANCSACGHNTNPIEAKFCAKCGANLAAGLSKIKTPVETTLEDQTAILADLWLNYRQDEDFVDFIEYNDIGLPLAYVIDNEIVESTEQSERFIRETFALLLVGLGVVEDEGFETLEALFEAAGRE